MSEETEFHMMAQDHFDCFDPYSEKEVPNCTAAARARMKTLILEN